MTEKPITSGQRKQYLRLVEDAAERALKNMGLDKDGIQKLLIENGDALLDKVADTIVEFVKQAKAIYAIFVDYAMSTGEMLKLGKYDWINDNITSNHFPAKGVGKMETKIELLHFNRNISSEKALEEMDKAGYRAAEAHELLAFGAKYPNVQREFPVVALGSIWCDPGGDRGVVCLGGDGAGRGASLGWFRGVWGDYWRFAVVRK